jgi:uncharacterized protein YsxB (DUF464 family)
MIHIEDRGRHSIVISGHAGYDKPGKDIICAGVSAIACALCEYLIKHFEEQKDINVTSECGTVVADVTPYDRYMEKYDALYAMARMGFATLEENYPNHIKYSKKYL